MQTFKQGVAAIAMVASVGLIVPASFGGPALVLQRHIRDGT